MRQTNQILLDSVPNFTHDNYFTLMVILHACNFMVCIYQMCKSSPHNCKTNLAIFCRPHWVNPTQRPICLIEEKGCDPFKGCDPSLYTNSRLPWHNMSSHTKPFLFDNGEPIAKLKSNYNFCIAKNQGDKQCDYRA